jgi:hypothetical protein
LQNFPADICVDSPLKVGQVVSCGSWVPSWLPPYPLFFVAAFFVLQKIYCLHSSVKHQYNNCSWIVISVGMLYFLLPLFKSVHSIVFSCSENSLKLQPKRKKPKVTLKGKTTELFLQTDYMVYICPTEYCCHCTIICS